MSYAEAKEIALARIELRTSWSSGDRAAAGAALARLVRSRTMMTSSRPRSGAGRSSSQLPEKQLRGSRSQRGSQRSPDAPAGFARDARGQKMRAGVVTAR
jgi:hypothetical protein